MRLLPTLVSIPIALGLAAFAMLASCAAGAAAPEEELVNLDFRDAPLSQVIDTFVYKRNVNIISASGLTQRVTVRLTGVPWKRALTTVLASHGLTYKEEDGVLRILKVEESPRKPVTRVYSVKNQRKDDVLQALAGIVTAPENARVSETSDPGTGQNRLAVVVTDTEEVQATADRVLRSMGSPRPVGQIRIETHPDETVSVDLHGADLGAVFAAIGREFNRGVSWEAHPQGAVDLMVENMGLHELIDVLLTPRGFTYDIDERLLRIGRQGVFVPRRLTRTFTLQYANAFDLKAAIEGRLTKEGRLDILVQKFGTGLSSAGGLSTQGEGAPPSSRLFVVTDTLHAVRAIEQLIRQSDTPPSQVSIEVQLVDVSLTDKETLGIDWNVEAVGTGAQLPVKFPFTSTSPNATLQNQTFTFGTVSFANFRYTVSALAARGRLRTLSKPTVSTLDGLEASILVGERFPILQETINALTGQRTVTATKFQDIGIRLRVAPRLMGTDQISLTIRPNVSLRGELLEGRFPVIETREVETQLMVRDGQTAVIGGLMQDRTEKTRTGIPGLLNLDVIGHLFGRRVTSRSQTELMIFVTPRKVATGTPIAAK